MILVEPIRLVFSNVWFVLLAFTIFGLMTFGMLIMSEYVFLEPYVISHLPPGTELGAVLIMMITGLSGVVIPMNVYRVVVLKRSKQKMGGGLFGSIVGAVAGACSCGPLGFAVISTFGTAGAVTTAFLTVYEIPLRIAAVVMLGVVYMTTIRSLYGECKINHKMI